MADHLNMNGLSLNDSQHANGMHGGRSAYVPPHLRGLPPQPPPGMDGPLPNGSLSSSAWAGPGPGYALFLTSKKIPSRVKSGVQRLLTESIVRT